MELIGISHSYPFHSYETQLITYYVGSSLASFNVTANSISSIANLILGVKKIINMYDSKQKLLNKRIKQRRKQTKFKIY